MALAQLVAERPPPAAAPIAPPTHPAWRTRLVASLHSHEKQSHSRYVQLATVRPDGRPANRTMVFRDFVSHDDDSLVFVADSRSRKMKELAYSKAAEVAWYFPCSREQYRLTGELDVVDGTTTEPNLIKARRRGWATMSDSARQQWVWPQPGAPRDNDPAVWTKRAPGPDEPPVDTFVLLVLRVEEVELLVLSSPSTCTHYSREVGPDGNYFWLEESLNP